MVRGLYSSAAGLLSTALREGVIADNLANSETPGYKARQAVLASFAPLQVQRWGPVTPGGGPFLLALAAAVPLGVLSGGALVDETGTDWSPGPLTASSAPLAVAIDGPGFFAVRAPQGVLYTRAGEFRFDGQGVLVSAQGYPVLDPALRPIRAPGAAAGPAVVDAQGRVTVGGAPVGQLGVFMPPTASLEPAGMGMFALRQGGAAPAATAVTLRPGYAEQSNVDLVGQMAALLEAEQAFVSDQRVLQVVDQTMAAALNDVAAVP
jgi:flagellar basal-body rod protein FlgF